MTLLRKRMIDDMVTPLSTVLTRLAQSLAQVFLGERGGLAFPTSAIPRPADLLAVDADAVA